MQPPAAEVAPEEEIPLDESQWRCKVCTYINTVENWTELAYANCQMCANQDLDIFS